MRVLQIGKFFPPEDGGIEQVTFNLSEGLAGIGIRSDVICFTRFEPREESRGGYSVFRYKTELEKMSTPMSTSLWRSLRARWFGYDLIHLHCPNPWPTLCVLAGMPPVPLVIHWHGDVVRYGLAAKAYRYLEHLVLSRATAIIATSNKYAQASPMLAPVIHKTVPIPIGIDTEALAPNGHLVHAIRARFSGRRIVLAVGRLIHYKGFDVLIRAAARLPGDCVVLIGGEGPLEAELSALIDRLGLRGRVVLLGKIPQGELASYYQACSIFCLPSVERAEAFGVVLLEAMALGRPIVATRIPGSGVDWVNEHEVTGLNVVPRDERALADAICSIAENRQTAIRFGEAGRSRFDRLFTRDRMAASVADLYHRVAGGKKSAVDG